MAIRAVVFDLGHTLWDIPAREESWGIAVERIHQRLLASRAGMDSPSAKALGRAIGLATADWEIRYTAGEEFAQPPSSYFITEALNSLDVAAGNGLIDELTEILFGSELAVRIVEPDTRLVLDQLRERGLRLACLTNTLLLEKAILDLLELLGLRQYFSSVVVSSQAGYRKPHPSLFKRALEELGIAPDESVFVGDSLKNDIAGARKAGMRAVLTRQYRREPVDAASIEPDAVVERLSELPGVIERLSTAG